MEKDRWQKAEVKLRKTLTRDTLNPSVRYVMSVFYFASENPSFHLDSAYQYIVGALHDYERSPERDRDRLRRAGLDSLHLVGLRARIDSAAFEVAKKQNTEAAYLEFLSQFPSAIQRDLAIKLRDEVAYQEALSENTYDAFLSFINRYPDARHVEEAKVHYHRLLYLERTKDKRLASYEKFLADHPDSPYRSEIYKNIFEITTADGSVSSFLSFVNRYPLADQVNKARRIVFHLLAQEEAPSWPDGFLNDSLRAVINNNSSYLVPFLKDERYGFMDENGREVIPPTYNDIHEDYLCGQVTDEILIADNQLVSRSGSRIFAEHVIAFADIGAGFLKVETAGGIKLLHKSGFLFMDSVTDARIIAGTFIAARRGDKWSVHALSGRQLDARLWDDIVAVRDVIVFSGDRKFVVVKDELPKGAQNNAVKLSEPFDDLRFWRGGVIWGRSGEYEGLLDQSLESVIGFDKHVLTQTSFGAVAEVPNGFVIYNPAGRRSTTFDQVKLLPKKVGVKKSGMWFLYDPISHIMRPRAYDSLRAEGAFVIGTRADSVYVHFANDRFHGFFRPGKIAFVPGRDSTSFLTVQENGSEKSVFDLRGERLFAASFDALEYGGKGLFVITRKDRKGLLDMTGKMKLSADFDAIGTVKGDVVSILKNKKFGAYHAGSGKLIKPQYDRNLIPYGATSVVTYKDGYYGLIGWDNKPKSAFEFDEISYWNDSLALVKKGPLWSVFDIKTRKRIETNLRGITLIKDTPDEKLAIIQRENNFGVISNRGKVIIPPTFSEVVNLGTADEPLYFTEKHVPEASIYIVIYYDRTGQMLRKEIYDNAGDYDKIYCSDN